MVDLGIRCIALPIVRRELLHFSRAHLAVVSSEQIVVHPCSLAAIYMEVHLHSTFLGVMLHPHTDTAPAISISDEVAGLEVGHPTARLGVVVEVGQMRTAHTKRIGPGALQVLKAKPTMRHIRTDLSGTCSCVSVQQSMLSISTHGIAPCIARAQPTDRAVTCMSRRLSNTSSRRGVEANDTSNATSTAIILCGTVIQVD
mmetsp:Transcript_52824/g.126152  ORF Transcript_52824/g.126152 Transcript_52824/m.126152 type:complete len:200 (-) Transcript_52824:2037-2636(-)